MKAVAEEIDQNTLNRPYKPPLELRRRKAVVTGAADKESATVAANPDATGVELHKDSRWFQSWENLKNNNPYINKMFEYKMKYDESDNPVVRASRAVTDKLTYLLGTSFLLEALCFFPHIFMKLFRRNLQQNRII